jgi:hypothetical protein
LCLQVSARLSDLYSLTAMVLRAANSIRYNPRGKPILSVSRAVTMRKLISAACFGI